MKGHRLDTKNRIGIATDRAPSMIGKNSGAGTLIVRLNGSLGRMFELQKGNADMPLSFAPGKLNDNR